jgi:hypothetical protein
MKFCKNAILLFKYIVKMTFVHKLMARYCSNRALTPLFGNGAGAIQIGKINVILGENWEIQHSGGKKTQKNSAFLEFCY